MKPKQQITLNMGCLTNVNWVGFIFTEGVTWKIGYTDNSFSYKCKHLPTSLRFQANSLIFSTFIIVAFLSSAK